MWGGELSDLQQCYSKCGPQIAASVSPGCWLERLQCLRPYLRPAGFPSGPGVPEASSSFTSTRGKTLRAQSKTISSMEPSWTSRPAS